VAFDQVGVVTIHNTHQIGEFGRTVSMQALPEPAYLALNIDGKVCQLGRDVFFEETRFYSVGCFYHYLPILSARKFEYS